MIEFQSAHPVRGATAVPAWWQLHTAISIHAPRAGCDTRTMVTGAENKDFNPRTPCGVRRWIRLLLPGTTNFNPRAPCGARLDRPVIFGIRRPISIHAPRVGRDSLIQAPLCVVLRRFQSTRPVWGATFVVSHQSGLLQFQSTRPVWVATVSPPEHMWAHHEFQSTRPVWGATAGADGNGGAAGISIHAPRVGRDQLVESVCIGKIISIHAPRVGRDTARRPTRQIPSQFQSTRPVWGATAEDSRAGRNRGYFNPRAPCGARQQI